MAVQPLKKAAAVMRILRGALRAIRHGYFITKLLECTSRHWTPWLVEVSDLIAEWTGDQSIRLDPPQVIETDESEGSE